MRPSPGFRARSCGKKCAGLQEPEQGRNAQYLLAACAQSAHLETVLSHCVDGPGRKWSSWLLSYPPHLRRASTQFHLCVPLAKHFAGYGLVHSMYSHRLTVTSWTLFSPLRVHICSDSRHTSTHSFHSFMRKPARPL